MKKLAFGLVALTFILSFLFWGSLPETVPTHWNAEGIADSFAPKTFGVFLLPLISLGVLLLFLFIPKIAVFKKNFEEHYEGIMVVTIAFLGYVHLLTLLQAYGIGFNMTTLIIPGIAGLFYYFGLILPNIKRNYFIGIRTPWALSDDFVWKKTHEEGGKVFRFIAILSLLFIAIPGKLMYWVGFILLSVAYIFYYSYKVFTSKKSRKQVLK